jgi:hypothetical protein
MVPTTTELRSEVPADKVGIWPRQAVPFSPVKEAEAHKILTRFSVATAALERL